MAIFDINADPNTAVNAWLAQFKVAQDGEITRVTTDNTYHVRWINRALQKIAWDFAISGDDEINLSQPNPSTSQAFGTIITLQDFTAGYGVRYRVNQEVIESHFGGSVTQTKANGLTQAWYALTLSGTSGDTVEPQIVQNAVQIPSYWGTGINQTDSATVARIMIMAVDDGVLIDGGRVTVKAHDFNFANSNFTATLGLTEAFSSVNADNDPFNNTDVAEVAAYGIDPTTLEQYRLLDLDGTGLKPYVGEFDYSPRTANIDGYEFVKYVLSRDSGQTLFGVDANLWTGRVFDVEVGGGSGSFVNNETISWATGTGNLIAMNDLDGGTGTIMYLHLGTGTAPVTGETITGASGATTVVGANGSVTRATSANWLGQFTGNWIAAPGVGFIQTQVTTADSFRDLNGVAVVPPNFVAINGSITTVEEADDPHVYLTKRIGNAPAPNEFTSTGATTGDGLFVINEEISADTPQTGYIGLFGANTTPKFYEYVSFSGNTFVLAGTLEEDYAAADEARLAYFYNSFDGATTAKTVSNTLVYQGVPIDVIGWIRQGDPAAPDTIILINGQITAGGFQFSGTLNREA